MAVSSTLCVRSVPAVARIDVAVASRFAASRDIAAPDFSVRSAPVAVMLVGATPCLSTVSPPAVASSETLVAPVIVAP